MKKIFLLILGIALVYSCSTSTDSNGNTNTTAVPVSPTNLTGTVASSTQINLSWTDNSTNETGFKIERKTGSGTYTIIGTTATDVTTFNDTGLIPSTTFTYRVYSNNAVGNSLTYSNEIIITTNSIGCPDVTIGNQIWSSCNLDVTTYRDGTPIPQVTDQTQWNNLTTGAWCYCNNDSTNGTIYGKLYNWYAVAGIYNSVSLNDVSLRKQFAPNGWHIPSDAEWTTLIDFLGGDAVAGGKMKETGTTHWTSPNTDATNSSSFTALPGGTRSYDGTFTYSIGIFGFWWSSSGLDNQYAFYRGLSNITVSSYRASTPKLTGASVRCIKD